MSGGAFRLYPVAQHWWTFADYDAVRMITRLIRPATVLEFGPGSSTLSLIEGGAGHIDCAEDDPHWYNVQAERLADRFPERVTMIAYNCASDPLSVPKADQCRYDMALIDGPRDLLRRPPIVAYCLERARFVVVPLEETEEGSLRPIVEALAAARLRPVDFVESGPLAGAFAIIGPRTQW